MKYGDVNESVMLYIAKAAKSLLDIERFTGNSGRKIKLKTNIEIIGITYSFLEDNHAASYFNQVLVKNLNFLNLLKFVNLIRR